MQPFLPNRAALHRDARIEEQPAALAVAFWLQLKGREPHQRLRAAVLAVALQLGILRERQRQS